MIDTPEYESRAAEEKQTILWREVLGSRYADLPALRRSAGPLQALRLVGGLLRRGRRTYSSRTDVLEPRTKLSHPFGVVAAAEFRAGPDPRAGGVLDGAPALVRLSISGHPEEGGYSPSMTLKFLIDGFPSVNLHLMTSIDGQQGEYDFFRDPLTNILPVPASPAGKLSAPLLARIIGQENPFRMDVDHLAFRDRTGAICYDPKPPHQVVFRPKLSLPRTAGDFREALSTIPPATELYEAWVRYSADGDLTRAGTVVTSTEFVASDFGDRVLHFHHRRWGVD
ncbi:hypothetical protein [Actinoplanes sp. NBRC 103695]|uniref:hypothetical protein n=1 Tax=Actinoplanes sp. NBRC 103695 TaxID=3032202 RepID=UPI00249FFC46|nr:hypothetical protein [Actinoplanes sp. NBRC 103695]GLY93853.1 hypothetical protein Acsp02_11090 [Actinoplanes sp. NBRC 103695]